VISEPPEWMLWVLVWTLDIRDVFAGAQTLKASPTPSRRCRTRRLRPQSGSVFAVSTRASNAANISEDSGHPTARRSDDGIMGDNCAPHAAGRAEQMLTGRMPAHGSREGPGGCKRRKTVSLPMMMTVTIAVLTLKRPIPVGRHGYGDGARRSYGDLSWEQSAAAWPS
jgi:hypothetical protein